MVLAAANARSVLPHLLHVITVIYRTDLLELKKMRVRHNSHSAQLQQRQ